MCEFVKHSCEKCWQVILGFPNVGISLGTFVAAFDGSDASFVASTAPLAASFPCKNLKAICQRPKDHVSNLNI